MSESPAEEPGGDHPPDRRRRRSASVVVLPIVWLVLGAAGGFAIVNQVRADDPPAADVTTVGPASTATAQPSAKATAKKPKKTKATPKAEATTEPTVTARTTAVVVYNQIGIGGLAARVAGQARTAGWVVADTGNWRGSVPQDTVYYPAGRRAEAELLGEDLAIARLMPAVANMSGTHLTVVLASRR